MLYQNNDTDLNCYCLLYGKEQSAVDSFPRSLLCSLEATLFNRCEILLSADFMKSTRNIQSKLYIFLVDYIKTAESSDFSSSTIPAT